MNNGQKALAAIIVIALAVAFAWYYANECAKLLTPEEATCSTAEKLLPAITLLPIFVLSGIIVGAIAFYLLSKKSNNSNVGPMLSLLPQDERTIVKRLNEKDGEAMQSELTNLDGMTKVKSHRAVQKLKEKGVVEVQQKGKTNIVRLTGKFRTDKD